MTAPTTINERLVVVEAKVDALQVSVDAFSKDVRSLLDARVAEDARWGLVNGTRPLVVWQSPASSVSSAALAGWLKGMHH